MAKAPKSHGAGAPAASAEPASRLLHEIPRRSRAGNDRESAPLARSSGASADVLSDVLRAVRLRGAVFFDVHASSPWVAESPPSSVIARALMAGADHVIPFHVVTQGACHGGLIGGMSHSLRSGDVIVFPHGGAHVMGSDPGRRAPPDLSKFRRSQYPRLPVRLDPGGGGRPRAHLICGFLGCDARPFNPLLESLPPVLVVRGTRLDAFVGAALAESKAPGPGGECLLARLSELLFIEAVRRHVQSLPATDRGWLAGLRDPGIGRALSLLHGEPAFEWTLDRLARESALSRSVLAERFTRLVGVPPMHYLARWRLQRASALLAEGGLKVAAAAEEVGYESEAAFSRAFKRFAGVSPSAWRRRALP